MTSTPYPGSTYPEYDTGVIAPLTTIFTPSPSCSRHLYNDNGAFTPVLGMLTDTQCYPTSFASAVARTPWQIFCGYYSPGVCPNGYTIACSEYSSFLNPRETGYVCCPSHYECLGSQIIRMCTSTITAQTEVTVQTETITSGAAASAVKTVSQLNSTDLPMLAWASPIRIRWKSADLSFMQEHITAPPSPAPGASSSSLIPLSTAEAEHDHFHATGPVHFLPFGAKIVIGIISPIIIVGAILAVLFFFQQRRRRAADARALAPGGIDAQSTTSSTDLIQFPARSYQALGSKSDFSLKLNSSPNLNHPRFGEADEFEAATNQNFASGSRVSFGIEVLGPRRTADIINTQISPTSTVGPYSPRSDPATSPVSDFATSPVRRKPVGSPSAVFGSRSRSFSVESGTPISPVDEEPQRLWGLR